MTIFKNISILFFVTIFLLSSTGIIVFESYCSCSGNESVSIYKTPTTCSENYHIHHSHDLAGNEIETNDNECHECDSHTNDCGCSVPAVKYLKLINQLNNEEVKFVNVNSNEIFVAQLVMNVLFSNVSVEIEKDIFYVDPPPQISSSTDFLIQINQLKIPSVA